MCTVQVLNEPGLSHKQQRCRAKAVKKLGSIFSSVNRPRNGPVLNIMEEFSEVLQVNFFIPSCPLHASVRALLSPSRDCCSAESAIWFCGLCCSECRNLCFPSAVLSYFNPALTVCLVIFLLCSPQQVSYLNVLLLDNAVLHHTWLPFILHLVWHCSCLCV